MIARLKSLVDLITSCDSNTVRPYVALEHVEGGTGRLLPDIELPELATPASGATAAEVGDVLFGKLRPYLAKTWLADRAVFASTELLCLRPRSRIDARWLGYVCASRSLVEWAVATSDGTKMPRTSWEKFSEYRLEVPSVDTQCAIADFLDIETVRIDGLMAKKKRMHQLLTTRLELLVESSTVTKVAGGPIHLKHVTSIERGRFNHRPRNDPALYGEEFPFVQTGDIRGAGHYVTTATQFLSGAGRRISKSFPAGTTLMGIAANVGDIAVTTFETWCPDSVVGFIPGPLIDPDYLYFLLRGLRRQINETSRENTQENTNIERLGFLWFPLPSMSAQCAISASLEKAELRVFALASALNRQIDLLRERRQALITALVTGEADVQEVSG